MSQEIGIAAEVSPSRFMEQAYFALRLVKTNGALSNDPVFYGLFSAGRVNQSIQGWIDGDYFDMAIFPDATATSLSEAEVDVPLFRMLGELVPAGGSLMVSYSLFSKESRIHKETKLGLDRGYPAVVTPIGFLLFMAGCGTSFKDWYFAEGGREGPEKLQGYTPMDHEVAKGRAELMLRELHTFLGLPQNQDSVARACKLRADLVMRELKEFLIS